MAADKSVCLEALEGQHVSVLEIKSMDYKRVLTTEKSKEERNIWSQA